MAVVPANWLVEYDADVLPAAASPVWTKHSGGTHNESVSGGILNLTNATNGWIYYAQTFTGNESLGATIEARLRINDSGDQIESAHGAVINFNIDGGSYFDFNIVDGRCGFAGISAETISLDTSIYHTYRITVRQGTARVYIDDVLINEETVPTDSNVSEINFGQWGGDICDIDWDYFYYRVDGVFTPLLNNWSTRRKIRTNMALIPGGATHNNFRAVLTDGVIPDAIYTAAQSAGQDLRITTDENGENEIAFDLVSFSASGKTCEAWALIPEVLHLDTTSLYIWSGHATAAAYVPLDQFGRFAVWGSEHRFVYHASNLNDASSSPRDATESGASNSTDTAGKIGRGRSFNGSNQRWSVSTTTPTALFNTGESIFISLWVNMRSFTGTASDFIFGRLSGDNTGVRSLSLAATPTATSFYIAVPSEGNIAAVGDELPENEFALIHCVLDEANKKVRVFVNGQEGTEASYTGDPREGTNVGFIARDPGSTATYADMILDEARYSVNSIPANLSDFVELEYNSQNDPESFWIDAEKETQLSESVVIGDYINRLQFHEVLEKLIINDSEHFVYGRVFVEKLRLLDVRARNIARSLTDSIKLSSLVARILEVALSQFAIGRMFARSKEVGKNYWKPVKKFDPSRDRE